MKRVILLLCFTMAFAFTPVMAQDAPASSSRTGEARRAYESLAASQQKLLDQLDHADETVRDDALTSLLSASPDDAQLDRMFTASVSPEQRHRLKQVAIHHVGLKLGGRATSPEDGAILGMSPVPQAAVLPANNQADDEAAAQPAANPADRASLEQVTGLAVRWTFPGSPAFAYLRQGDVIIEIDCQPLQMLASDGDLTTRFIQHIAQKKAGAPLSLKVLRHGRALQINLELGSEAALRSLYDMSAGSAPRQYAPEYASAIKKRLATLEALQPQAEQWVIETKEAKTSPAE